MKHWRSLINYFVIAILTLRSGEPTNEAELFKVVDAKWASADKEQSFNLASECMKVAKLEIGEIDPDTAFA